VRSLLKRSLLLGIATIDEPDEAWVSQVKAWLQEDTWQDVVRETVVYQHLPWMDKLEIWIKNDFTLANEARRSRLLALLAAVSCSRGNFVADCLNAWSQQDASVLTQADYVFWHDPSEDSEHLFELRLRYLAETQRHHGRHLQWDQLLTKHPMRSMRLLAYHLSGENNETLIAGPPEWFWGWPSTLPPLIRETGLATWQLLKPYWNSLTVKYTWDIRVGNQTSSRQASIAAALVDIFRVVLAHAIEHQQMTWSHLVQELPPDNRFIDGWLLLRVGASLVRQQTPAEEINNAAHWFMNNPQFSDLAIGMDRQDTQLAEQFIANIALGLDNETHDVFVQWLINYPEQMGITKTTADTEDNAAYHEVTKTRYRLLFHTDRHRWSAATTSLAAEWAQLFGPVLPQDVEGIHARVGWVRSDISDSVALQMSCAKWVEALRSASTSHERSRVADNSGSILSGDLRTRIRQLNYIVPHHPQRFYDGLPLFIDATPPLPSEVIQTVIDGIVRLQKPNRPPPQAAWEPLSDAAVAKIFAMPAIRENRDLAATISDVVRNRSHYAWSDDIINRLITTATGETVAGTKRDAREGLIHYRINEQACRALDALANCAVDHDERRPPFLALAKNVMRHADPGRRASAGMLAFQSRTADPQQAYAIVLNVSEDLQVAGEDDVGKALLAIASSDDATAEQKAQAIAILLHLIDGDDRLAQYGGNAALILHAWKLISHDTMMAALIKSTPARRSAAETLADGLQQLKPPQPWMLALAITFANDDDEAVGKSIMQAFDETSDHLLNLTDFFSDMVHSKAAKRDPQDMLELCCKSGDMVTHADNVITMVTGLTDVTETAENYRRISAAIDVAMNTLQTLAAQAEQVGNRDKRNQALDAWDHLIDRGFSVAQHRLNVATDFGIG